VGILGPIPLKLLKKLDIASFLVTIKAIFNNKNDLGICKMLDLVI
jgi:hypothetical protein